MKFKFPLHIHLSTLFILMTLVISGVIAGVGYQMSYNMLETSAQDLTQRASREIAGEIKGILGPAYTTVELFTTGWPMPRRRQSAWQVSRSCSPP